MVMEALAYGMEYAGATIYIFRETFDDLEANIVAEWKKRVPPELYVYHETKHIATLYNGTKYFFRYVKDKRDAEQYDGRSIDAIFVDELTKHEEVTIQQLLSCLRSPLGFPPRFRASCNPGSIGHCVPYGEVLTPVGWVDIKALNVGDTVYAVTSEGSMVKTKIEQYHEHYYDGNLWVANAQGLSIVCTPEHRIARKGHKRKASTTGDFSLTAAIDLPGQAYVKRSVEYSGKDIGAFTLKPMPLRKRHEQPLSIDGDNYAEFMGWFLSEGSTANTYKHKYVSLAQRKEPQRIKIEDLLNRCGFKYKSDRNGFYIYSPEWAGYCSKFGLCRDKYVPRALLNSSKKQLRIFFEAAVDGDGVWASNNSGQYYTTSKQLADDIAEIGIKIGYTIYTSSRQRDNREGLTYCVNFKTLPYSEIITGQHCYSVDTEVSKEKHVSFMPYKGMVYDIGIPGHHTFILRQNGSVWVSGNSWVKKKYILPTDKGKKTYIDDISGSEVAFIPATVYDNEAIMMNDPQYVRRLENLPPKKKQAFLHGDWDMYDGQAFEEFAEEIHVVKPFDIPDHWYRWRSVDNGHTDPFAWYWFAVDEAGFVYVYREFTREKKDPKLTYSQQAAKVLELSSRLSVQGGVPMRIMEPIGVTYCGHDAFATHPMAPGKSIAYFYQKAGVVPIQKSIPDRTLRKAVWHEYLQPFEYEGKTVAKVRIFDTCEKLIETLPQLSEDEKDPEKYAECGFDHWADGAGYGLVSYHLNKSQALVTQRPHSLPWPLRTEEDQYIEATDPYAGW
jgi:intein/homing endonuclease